VALGSNLNTLTFGTYLTGTSYNGSGAVTLATNATNANTASTLVARDASGNFSAGTITASLSGNATTATTASNVNNGTLTMNVSGTGLSGSQTFTANQSGNATFTVTSNATATAGAASTIVARDASGYIFNNYFNSTDNSVASGVSAVMVKSGDNYLRSGTAAAIATFISGQTMNIAGNATNITAYTINQSVGTGNGPTFTELYNNGWFRNNSSNTGLYNQSTTQHWSSQSNGYWDASSTTSVSGIRFYTGGHVSSLRGYVYADNSNQIGFLNNAGSWSWKMDNSGNGVATGFIRSGTNFYNDSNYGYGLVGAYASTIFQGFFAMGDAYKLTAGGAINNLYGVTWSYPSAGGIAGNLDSHGLIVAINGGFGSCLSYNVKASGNVTAYSDERLKKNWEPLCDNFVEKLAKVKVGTYERTDLPMVQVGVSAQSLEEVLPEAVSTATDDMKTKSVSYGNAALASAVMLAQEVVELKQMMKQLQAELAELKRGA